MFKLCQILHVGRDEEFYYFQSLIFAFPFRNLTLLLSLLIILDREFFEVEESLLIFLYS